MPINEMLVLACSLAMDSFAVSLVFGTRDCLLKRRQAVAVAVIFAIVQGSFITIAWLAGSSFKSFIDRFDHWIAFGLLAFVAIHMLREGKAKLYAPLPEDSADDGESEAETGAECREVLSRVGKLDEFGILPASLFTLVGLAVATSIDSLGAGVGVSLVEAAGWTLTAAVTGVTFVFACFGAFLGRKVRSTTRISAYAYILGGLILLSISLEILYDHGVF